ncbi:UBP5 like deubiquitinating enzyme with a UB hydrolase domain and two UBA domains at the C-terminus [Cryptosporidium ryanae]|uniref:UBP5 like deubiquitinating enzyme with a UB hydrolase domain and two UBA domains at the C-terminus n=1 Tax=Cryptosporidium ryanae TaxID=515981 RepID=UPI00351A3E50|nr:UBP5 like deubiquitinating enzyme with a UB hydrolase domain and two UBA domains at the C-terminus [Cryptosporidium ryanae]
MNQDICKEYIECLNGKILNREPVYKTQCQMTFKDAFSYNGLYLNLKNLDAYCEDYLKWNSSLTGCRLYLNIQGSKEFQVENVRNPTNISIEKEGGYFFDSSIIKELYTYKIVEMPSKTCFKLGEDDIPSELEEKLKYVIQYDLNNDIVKEKDSSSEVSSWSEERKVSKYASNLFQISDSKKISSSGWKCEKCGSMSNLWLNLSDGYIGCGRKLYGVGGGCFDGKEEGAALLHYKEYPERPLVVKLGTITQFGAADVFSYDPEEDDLVLDPDLIRHLATFGINVGILEKTEKNLTELQIEQNNRLDFRSSEENDYSNNGTSQSLVSLERIGIRRYFVGIENAGNTCYINVILQFLSGIPEVRKLFVEHFNDLIDIYSTHLFKKFTPRSNVIIQFSKVMNALVSNDVYIDRKYKIDNCILDVQNAKNKLKDNNINDNIIESIFGSETDYNYVNILPLVFKRVISHGNSEFSSSHQQDTQEYFSFLLEKLRENLQVFFKLSAETDNKLVDSIKDFLSLFSFTHIERLECKQTGKVRLINSVNNFISLSIPNHFYSTTDPTETKQSHSLSSQRVYKKQRQDGPDTAENDGPQGGTSGNDNLSSSSKNATHTIDYTENLHMEENKGENQKPIDLNFLLKNWNSEETIDNFLSPCTNAIGEAGKTNYLKTMPRYLVIQIKRFYLSQDWKPRKITANVDAPEFLDIEFLRRPDSLYDSESPFPDDNQSDHSNPSCHKPTKDKTHMCGEPHLIPESLLVSILDLGFTRSHAEQAVKSTGTMDLDTCVDWILSNSSNLKLGSGYSPSHVEEDVGIFSEGRECSDTEEKNGGDSLDGLSEDLVQNVIAICCCSRTIALRALRVSNGDMQRAIQIIFDDPSMLESLQFEQCKAEGSSPVSFDFEKSSKGSDGEGKYELVAVICHLGNSVHSGHYICYLKRNFNFQESDVGADSELSVGENCKWFKFNDTKISLCKGNDLLQKESGYIYIYRRI